MADEVFLKVKTDFYKGVTVNVGEQSYSSPQEFEQKLEHALRVWHENGVRAVWINVPSSASDVIPICVQHEFTFHHVELERNSLTLTRFLPKNEPNNLPDFASHSLGCGGMVINSKGELLVIQERFTPLKHWKLPGGLADKGEDLGVAAVREVKEETGIDTEFLALLGFRHMHNFRWGCGDLYTVCLLRPVDEQQELKPCQHEIAECKWMDFTAYMADPNITSMNLFFAQRYLDINKRGSAIQATPILSYNKKRLDMVYAVNDFPPKQPGGSHVQEGKL